MGGARPRALALRDRPERASIGFVNGRPAGSSVTADLVGRAIRPAAAPTSAPAGCSNARRTPSPRYVARTQGDAPLASPRPPTCTRGHRLAIDRRRHDGAAQRVVVGAVNTDTFAATRPRHRRPRRAGRRLLAWPSRSPAGATVITAPPCAPRRRDRLRAARRWSRLRRRARSFSSAPTRQRRQRAGQLRLSDLRATSTPGAFDLQHFQVIDDGAGMCSGCDPRPDADLRQPARGPAGRRLRAPPGRGADLDPGVVPAAQLPRSRRRRLGPPDRGAGLRAALRRCRRQRRSARSRSAPTRSRGSSRSACRRPPRWRPASGWGFTVVLTGQDGFSPDQARGFQPTPQGVPVRRVRDGERRSALHGRPGNGAQGDGRDHAGRREQSDELDYRAPQPGHDRQPDDPRWPSTPTPSGRSTSHVHAEIARSGHDPMPPELRAASQAYFRRDDPQPTADDVAAHYRERGMACVVFPVDCRVADGCAARVQRGGRRGRRRQPRRDDPVRQHRPGPRARRRARGAPAHRASTASAASSSTPTCRAFFPDDRAAYPLYEVIAEAGLPALFHTGHSGIGVGPARRRRHPPEVLEPDARRRRRRRLPDHADRARPSVVPLAGRGDLDRAAQAGGLHRPVGLVAEVLPAPARALRQHAAAAARSCSARTSR